MRVKTREKGIVVLSTLALIAIIGAATGAGLGIGWLLFHNDQKPQSNIPVPDYVTVSVTRYGKSYNLADQMLYNFGEEEPYGDLLYMRVGAVYVQGYIDKNISDATALALRDSTMLTVACKWIDMTVGTLNNQLGTNISTFVRNDGVFNNNSVTIELKDTSGTDISYNFKQYTVEYVPTWYLPPQGYLYSEGGKILSADYDIILYDIDGNYKGTYHTGSIPDGLYKFSTTAQWIHTNSGIIVMNETAFPGQYGSTFFDGFRFDYKITDTSNTVTYTTPVLSNPSTTYLIGLYESNSTEIYKLQLQQKGLMHMRSAIGDMLYYTYTGAILRYRLLHDMGYTDPSSIPEDLILPYPDVAVLNTRYFSNLSIEEMYMLYVQYIRAVWYSLSHYDENGIITDPNATAGLDQIKIGDIRGKVILCDIYVNNTLKYIDAYCFIGTWKDKLHFEVGQKTMFTSTIPVFIIAANLSTTTKAPTLNPDDFDVIYKYIELHGGDYVYVKGIWVNGNASSSVDIDPKQTDDFDEGGGQGSGGVSWNPLQSDNYLQLIAIVVGVLLILYGIFKRNTGAVIVGIIIIAASLIYGWWLNSTALGWCIWIA